MSSQLIVFFFFFQFGNKFFGLGNTEFPEENFVILAEMETK